MPDRPDITRSAVLLVAVAGRARATVRGLDDDEYFWEPSSEAVMTIGWRVAHLVAVLETYTANTFEDRRLALAAVQPPMAAADAVARLHIAQDAFVRHVAALDDGTLTTATRTHWDETLPLSQPVWTPMVEQFHHGAEIGALRDVRRGYPGKDWWPELQGPNWWPAI